MVVGWVICRSLRALAKGVFILKSVNCIVCGLKFYAKILQSCETPNPPVQAKKAKKLPSCKVNCISAVNFHSPRTSTCRRFVYYYGANLSIFHSFSLIKLKYNLSCNRLGRPCQNSKVKGRTRYPPQWGGFGTFSPNCFL